MSAAWEKKQRPCLLGLPARPAGNVAWVGRKVGVAEGRIIVIVGVGRVLSLSQ